MNAVTLRSLSPEATQALEARAAENGRTPEAEIAQILEEILVPPKANAGKPASELVHVLQELGKAYPELSEVVFSRDQTLARSISFE